MLCYIQILCMMIYKVQGTCMEGSINQSIFSEESQCPNGISTLMVEIDGCCDNLKIVYLHGSHKILFKDEIGKLNRRINIQLFIKPVLEPVG